MGHRARRHSLLVRRTEVHHMSAIPGAAMPLRLRMALLSAIGLLEAMVFGLTHPIYALNLQQQGFSESEIGFNATLGGPWRLSGGAVRAMAHRAGGLPQLHRLLLPGGGGIHRRTGRGARLCGLVRVAAAAGHGTRQPVDPDRSVAQRDRARCSARPGQLGFPVLLLHRLHGRAGAGDGGGLSRRPANRLHGRDGPCRGHCNPVPAATHSAHRGRRAA